MSDDDLRLTMDIWDMSRDVNPQVRLTSSFRFMEFFHIDFGAADLVNDERNPSVFVGLGLSFVDEDLKYLLAKSPVP
jgi:hypothetical protein